MAIQTKPLTNTEIERAKPREAEYNLMDGSSLMLRAKPNGSKTWLFNYYRPHTGKRANMTLGSFPAPARDKAREARELLAQDVDPQEYQQEQARQIQEAHGNTVGNIARKWIDVKKHKITPAYAEDIWRSFENYLIPKLGQLPLHKIKAPAVIAILEPIAAKGALETVKRLTQRINEVMTFAVNTGLLDANPLAGMEPSQVCRETAKGLAAQRRQQFHQFYDGSERLWFGLRTEALRQHISTPGGNGQMFAGDCECVARAFVIAWNVQLETAHHFITIQRSLNVFIVKQQPQLETGHRGNGLKTDRLPGIALELAIQRRGQCKSIVITVVVITVKNRVDLLECAALNVLVAVAILE